MSRYANPFLLPQRFIGNGGNIQTIPTPWLWQGNGTVFPHPPVPPPLIALQSDTDNNWYCLNGVDIGGGAGILSCNQLAVAAGASPFVVLLNTDDGLHYKFQLTGTPPDVFWTIDPVPTLAGVDAYSVGDLSGNVWTLTIVNDGDLTVQLTLV